MVAFGGGDYTHFLEWWLNWQDVGRNVSSVHFKYWIRRNTSSGNGAYNGGTKRFTIWINHFGDQNEYRSYDFRKYQDLTVVEFDREIGHDGNGYQSVGTAASFEGHSQYFPYAHSGNQWFDLPRIPKRPGPVTNMQAINISQTSAGVQYNRGNDNGSGLTRDRAHWYEGGPAGSGRMIWEDLGPQGYTSPNGGATPGSVPLKPATGYWVYIRSENALGEGDWQVINFTTAAGVPGPVKTFSPVAQPGAMVQANWEEPVVVGGSAITRYEIQYTLDDNFQQVGTVTAAGTDRSKMLGPLAPEKYYGFRIRAVNSYGAGPWVIASDSLILRGGLRRWSGSALQPAVLRRWDGTAWRGATLKRWDGNTWAGTK